MNHPVVPHAAPLDPKKFPHVRALAEVLPKHDVEKELELGVDLLLDGAVRRLKR